MDRCLRGNDDGGGQSAFAQTLPFPRMRRIGAYPRSSSETMDVLLIPGFMLDADLWTDMRSGLNKFGRIIDVDTTRDASIEGMAKRAMTTTDGPLLVIGFSMGGYVAREIAYQVPNRVKGIALIATSCEGDNPDLARSRSRALSSAGSFRRLSRGAVERSLSAAHRTEVMIERVQRMSERLGGDVLALQSSIFREGDKARLPTISCPTVIVAAADDELRTISESETLRDGIAGASLTIVEGSGHLIPLEQPKRLLDAIMPLARIGP